MVAEQLVDDLRSVGVLAEGNSTDTLRLSRDFRDTVAEYRRELADDAEPTLSEVVREHVADTDLAAVLTESDDVSRHVFPEFLALSDATDDLSESHQFRVAITLNQLDPELPPSEGCPNPFLPVHGDRLPLLTQLYSRAVVYVWRHECHPCNLVKSDLEAMIDRPELPLYAVFGPDHAEFLSRTYDVVGGPTTLFFVSGEVDMRLQGAYPPESLYNSLQRFGSDAIVKDDLLRKRDPRSGPA
jgi:hypothetical protein